MLGPAEVRFPLGAAEEMTASLSSGCQGQLAKRLFRQTQPVELLIHHKPLLDILKVLLVIKREVSCQYNLVVLHFPGVSLFIICGKYKHMTAPFINSFTRREEDFP